MRRGWYRALRLGSVERDVAEEFAFHRARTIEDLMAGGATRAEAEAEARRRFGDEARWTREVERTDRGSGRLRRARRLALAAADIGRTAGRGVRRNPGLALGIVSTFALGVGANAVMFGMVDRVLLRPPQHVEAPDGVKRLMVERLEPYLGRTAVSDKWTYPDYAALDGVASLAAVAAYSERDAVVGHGRDAREVRAVLVTGGFFSLLGTRPALGRFFGEGDDERGGPRVAVLGYGYWRRELGGDPGVLGATVALEDGPYEVIGVAPRGFTGVELGAADLWLPLHVAGFPGFDGWMTNPYWYWLRAVGRLAQGAAPAVAETEATRAHRLARGEMVEAGDYDAEARVVAAPLIAAQGPRASKESTVVRLLAGVSLIVLAIAAFNVANLLLARTSKRRREVAVRLALGISRGRLVAEMLAEGALLALLGGVVALAVAVVGGGALQRLLLPDVVWGDALTWRLAVFTLIVAGVAGVAATLIPVAQALRGRLSEALHSSRGSVAHGSRTRTALTAAQAALSVLLLVGAGLYVRSLARVDGLDLGVDVDDLLMVMPQGISDLSSPERERIMETAQQRVAGLPGVASVAPASWSRLFAGVVFNSLRVPGRDSLPELASRTPAATLVTEDYLGTLGLTLRRGRWIRPDDVAGAPPVVVVNRAMADLVFAGDAIGRCFHVEDGPCLTIVGVVETAKQASPLETPRPQYYMPLRQQAGVPAQLLYVRLGPDAEGAIAAVRSAFLTASPSIRFVDVYRVTDRVAPYLRPWRLGATLFSSFGLLALLVAAIGLYSLLAYEVVRRTPEIGVRAALGATRARLVRGVVGRSVGVVAFGLGVGLAAAWALAPRIEGLLFEVSPRDGVTFVTVLSTLLFVSVAAAAEPARRASRVDPNEALRVD